MTSSHDVERALVQGLLDVADDRLADATAAMQAELDHLRESWSSGYAQQLADHEDRVRKMREDHRAWINSLYDGDADEPAHTDVAGGQQDAPAGRNAPATPGPVPQQPHPHAAELAEAEAERIRTMSMQEYAKRRAELGVQSPTSMSRLSGY